MPKISVPQKNLTLDATQNENLMVFLQTKQVPVASSCLGDGICGKCKMKVIGPLPQPTELEKNTLSRNNAPVDERLACQILIEADLIVNTTYW